MSSPAPSAPLARPDWSGDSRLKPWMRGQVLLPFATSERSEADNQIRFFGYVAVSGVVMFAIIFGIMVWAGLVPVIHTDPRITYSGTDPWMPVWFSLGCAGVGMVAVLLLAGPMVLASPVGPGHPWTFDADATTFRITDKRGNVAEGSWAAWSLAGYDTAQLSRGGAFPTVLHLSLNGAQHSVRITSVRAQRRFLRMVVQKIAIGDGRAG